MAARQRMLRDAGDVPVKRCSKGHIIPRNGDIFDGVVNKRPMVACETCAKEASRGVIPQPRAPKLRGDHKATEDQLAFNVPSIFID